MRGTCMQSNIEIKTNSHYIILHYEKSNKCFSRYYWKQNQTNKTFYHHFIHHEFIILWIELPWQENLANTCAWHTETLDTHLDLIRSHQQCILWSPPLEIEPVTTEYRAETLPLSYQSTSYTSDAKLTSYGNCVAN